MVRKIDDLGRLVLPAEIRRRFGLGQDSHVEIHVDDAHEGRIVLTPVRDACVFCGSDERLREFRSQQVCSACVDHLAGRAPDAPPDPAP